MLSLRNLILFILVCWSLMIYQAMPKVNVNWAEQQRQSLELQTGSRCARIVLGRSDQPNIACDDGTTVKFVEQLPTPAPTSIVVRIDGSDLSFAAAGSEHALTFKPTPETVLTVLDDKSVIRFREKLRKRGTV